MKLRRTASDLCDYIENVESLYIQGFDSLEITIHILNEIKTTTKTLYFANIINSYEFEYLMTTINGTKNNILK